jgi:hypothetical protein
MVGEVCEAMGQPGMKFRPDDTKNSYRGLETHTKKIQSRIGRRDVLLRFFTPVEIVEIGGK